MTGLQRTQMPPAMTDDELVALAIMHRTSWGGPLPTVDQHDADALAAVSARGFRTLVTRGLMTGPRGGEPVPVPALLEGIRPAFEGTVRVAMFATTPTWQLVPGAPTGAVFADLDGHALVDSVSALGIHFFSEGPVESALAAVTRTARRVIEVGVTVAGPDGERVDDELALCVTRATGVGAGPMLLARAGTWRVVDVDEAGRTSERERPDAIEEAIEALAVASMLGEPT